MKTKLLLVFAFLAFQSSFANTFVNPIVPDLQPLQYCDPNNDGFGTFDLSSLTSIIVAAQSGSASDYVVTYHETTDDAQTGDMPVGSPYNNINPWSQIIYYRVTQISNNTYATGTVNIIVNPSPEATTPTDYSLCDYNGNGVGIFNLTTKTAEILGSINPSTTTVTFYTTLASAEAGLNAIVSINAYSGSNGQTIYARLTNNATGCYDLANFQLHVEPIPLSIQPNYPEYALCDFNNPIGYETFDLGSRINMIAMGQIGVDVTFYSTLYDAQSGTNQIVNLQYTNEVQYVQTLGIRVTNQATGCYTISTMDIRVSPLPQLMPPLAPYAVCDDNQDGTAIFDLTSLIPGLISSAAYTISFHETLTDAELFGTTIPNPSFYTNINPFHQTIYVRGADNITGCSVIIPIELEVNPSPIAVSMPSIVVCDSDTNTQNSMTLIDLTQQTPTILEAQPLPALSYLVTYFTSQSSAEAGLSPIVPANNYIGSDGEIIWYRVELGTTHCFAVGSFNIIINRPLPLTTPTPLQVCDSDANPNDQYTVFDLTIKDPEMTQGSLNAFVTYYPSLLNAQNGTNAISNPTTYINTIPTVQTLGVIVTSSSGCQSMTTLDIRVLPIPTPNTNPPALVPQCDVNNAGDMLEVFDLTVNSLYITNGDPALNYRYFHTMADAEMNINEIATPTLAVVGGNVWVRVENNRVDFSGNHCYVLVEQPLTVNPLPNPQIISDNTLNTVYVDGSNNVVQPLTLNVQLNGNYSFEWSVDGNIITDATSSSYIVNTASPAGQSRVFTVTAEDLTTGCSSSPVSITVLQSVGTPSPLGLIFQEFNSGDTLADLNVNGANILWYSSAVNKNPNTTFSTPLPLNTLLVDNTTYYASQTIGGIESIARLPVTARMILGVPTNEVISLQFAPNPVKSDLILRSTVALKSIVVYTMLGQKVFDQNYNDTDVTIDLSKLAAGNYVLKAQSETGQKSIRIIKQ